MSYFPEKKNKMVIRGFEKSGKDSNALTIFPFVILTINPIFPSEDESKKGIDERYIFII
jgi:hypothetical protein